MTACADRFVIFHVIVVFFLGGALADDFAATRAHIVLHKVVHNAALT
jgi:hypothetical protein